MTDKETKIKLKTALAALRAASALIELELDSEPQSERSHLLCVGDETRDQYHCGREALMAAATRGEIALVRGARRRVMVERSELERWIKSRPVTPGPRRAPVVDLDAWDREADRSIAGGK